MAIFLLPYIATFSEQFYFWRSFFFTLFQSNYFDTTFTFSEQLFLQSSCFFEELLFQNNHFFLKQLSFQNSYFFKVKLVANSHLLRIESSSGQLLFRSATFLAEELFRIKMSTEELFFRRRYFCTASFFSEKSDILEKANFSEKQYSALPTFSGELPFQSGYFFKRRYHLWQLSFQNSYILWHTFSKEFHSYASFPQLHFLLISF